MNSQIVLDEKSFKALSADSRVSILKNLGERRKTLTELSQKLNLGSSTVKEHCDILVNAELIKQIDEGRKWKYYELTSKGKQITQPNLFDEVKVLIVLCLSTLIVGGFVFFILLNMTTMQTASGQSFDSSVNYSGEMIKATATPTTETLSRDIVPQIIQGISFEVFAASVIIALICGIILGWYFTRRR